MGPFRPASFSNPASGGDAAATSGIGGGAEHGALNSLDIHGAHAAAPALNGSEAAHLATAGSHATGAAIGNAAMAAIPVGGEPVSPLIQLIMRMPGALGMGTSFFEWLSHMFTPGAHDLIPGIDPALLHVELGGHMAALQHVLDAGQDSFNVSLSSMTADMPIFHNLGQTASGLGANLDASSLAVTPYPEHFMANPDNLGGPADPGSAQFEAGHSADSTLAGPSISNPGTGNYLAGNHRLFGDHLGNPNAGNTLTSPTNVPMTSGMPSTASGATFGQEASQMPVAHAPTSVSAPAVGDNAGMQLAGRAQPSLDTGSASNINPNTLASDVPSYHPTSGSYYAPAANGSPSGIDRGTGVEPLKAKQLTFDDIRKGAGGTHSKSVMDHIGHQFKAGMQPSSSAVDATYHHVLPKAYTTSGSNDATAGHAAQQTARPTQPASHPVAHNTTHIAAHQKLAQVSHVSEAQSTPHAQDASQQSVRADAARTDDPSPTGQTSDRSQSTDAMQASDSSPGSQYTVEKGDNLWNIAEKNLGDGSKWTQIYKLNHDSIGQNPNLIFSGTHLKLSGAGGSQLADASHYTVRPGDNLWNIAKSHLGNPAKWGDLYKANAGVIGENPNLIMPGQELNLPPANPNIAQAPPALSPAQAAPQTISSSSTPAAGGFEQQAAFEHPAGSPVEQHAVTAMQPQGFEVQTAIPQHMHPVGFEHSAAAAAAQAPRLPAQPTAAPMTTGAMQFQTTPLESHPVPGVSLSASDGIPVSSNGMIQVAPVKALPVGPGAAGAATLKAGSDSVVSSSLAPDLSFLSKRPN